MGSRALVIEGLEKRFAHRTVLRAVNLTVDQGGCAAIIGQSGAGKTTLLRLIAGLDTPEAGTIAIDGTIVFAPGTRVPPHRRKVGMVFQDLALWPHLKAWENVEFMLPATLRSRNVRRDRARQWLTTVRLPNRDDAYPHQLSRGEQQRVALARSLAGEPRLLLLDEPFSSLDGELKTQMTALVAELHVQLAVTLLYVSHARDELRGFARQIFLLAEGALNDVTKQQALWAS